MLPERPPAHLVARQLHVWRMMTTAALLNTLGEGCRSVLEHTHAADHLTNSFDQRTEEAGALKCGFKQVFVLDAGTWKQNLNSPVGHSDGGEAGSAAERPTIRDGRTLTHRDENDRARARSRRAVPPPHFERRY